MKEWKEIQNKEIPELVREMAASREKLRDLRFRISQGQHKDVREVREIRVRIARLATLVSKRSAASSTARETQI
ncbi:50S ribosomal protein L29 [Candidatus Uhrbacteria bacterium RIFCSPHIGHO2_12_FULL_57_11]|uniref:Large ribosomal subunit protein uL29 n=2 Tax=Candidatus Uhriibacteriota TaxID=1752732 RepID=A0A1F7ULG3_9BACT|nr:MAG: 50S ribosomal protein L29 [Candidatus Uhrbacteria bacterium RIFCSPHIGHO2_02_FULL_57_19]OGL78537.1 MAG: 50S ribosomal protein L29 [Candidatus Uhrbacteria bacterium RIFCSPHIGHO2_12_FULL_57_11]